MAIGFARCQDEVELTFVLLQCPGDAVSIRSRCKHLSALCFVEQDYTVAPCSVTLTNAVGVILNHCDWWLIPASNVTGKNVFQLSPFIDLLVAFTVS